MKRICSVPHCLGYVYNDFSRKDIVREANKALSKIMR